MNLLQKLRKQPKIKMWRRARKQVGAKRVLKVVRIKQASQKQLVKKKPELPQLALVPFQTSKLWLCLPMPCPRR